MIFGKEADTLIIICLAVDWINLVDLFCWLLKRKYKA